MKPVASLAVLSLSLTLVAAKGGLLKTLQKSSGRRPAVYAFKELLNIAEGREVF